MPTLRKTCFKTFRIKALRMVYACQAAHIADAAAANISAREHKNVIENA
jgi:hypothetical protein